MAGMIEQQVNTAIRDGESVVDAVRDEARAKRVLGLIEDGQPDDAAAGGENPYLLLQREADSEAKATDPSLADRFWLNFEAGKRHNTILGAAYDASTPSRQWERKQFDRKYEAYPEWDGFFEGGAALFGQIGGTAMSVENFVPAGLGEKVLVGSKAALSGIWAKVFAGAVDGAAANAVADAAIQGIEISAEFRDGFDPVQYGASVLLGAGIGGAGGAAGKVIGDRMGADAARAEPAADNPYLRLADDMPEEAVPAAAPAAEALPATALPEDAPIGEVLSMRANDARGITPEQVQRVVKKKAPIGERPKRPQTLMDFLASEGGIRDDGGELAAMGVGRKFVPGRGALVRQSGRELDKAREAAAQAGYFNHLYRSAEEAAEKSTVRDLLDLIDQESRGTPAYSLADADRIAAQAKYEEALAGREDYRRFLGDMASEFNALELDVDVDDGVVARMGDLVLDESITPIEAFDRVMIELEASLEAMRLERGERHAGQRSADDIPFFDDADPAADPGPRRLLGKPDRGGGSRGRGGNEADGGASAGPRLDGEARGDVSPAAGKAEKDLDEFFMSQPLGGLAKQRTRAGSAVNQAVDRVARVRETAEALAKALDVTATRQGRTGKGKRVLGIYKTGDGVVRVRSLDDFDVLSHEYGHHLDAKVPAVKGFIKAHSAELARLDYDPVSGRDFEGFAEFFRLWLTNRAYVDNSLPALSAEFRSVLDQVPAMRDAIDAATRAWDDFLSAPSTVAVRSTIVSAKRDGWLASAAKELRKSGLGGTVADVLQRFYTFAFDDLHPINRAVSYLQDLHLTNTGKALDLKVTADPYKLARMSRGAYSAGHMDLMYGVAPYRGTHPASPSLRDAIIEATGKPNVLAGWDEGRVADFGAYLWSRRAIGEWERFRKGEIPNPPDKLTEGDHIQNVADLEAANPAFVSAAAKVHEFSRALWKKKLDAGLIDPETYDDGLRIRDYVPGLRDFSSDTDMKVPGGRSKGGTAKGGFVKRFRGSKRDVINPLESLAADAYETAMAIARNDVVKSLHRLALNAGPGGGAIAEIVPAKALKGTMIDPIEAVTNAARAAGLAKPDITILRDAVESAVGSEKAAVFRPAIINEKGEPIVFFRDGGQLKALRLADGKFGLDMYRVLTAMSQHEKNFWIELMAMPARALRFGITAAPEFIIANFVRDQVMATVYYGKALTRIPRTLWGGVDDLWGTRIAQSYSRTYGISGGQEVASLAKVMAERDIAGLRRKGWFAKRFTSWKGFFEMTEIAETSTRIGLFRTFKAEAEARGLDEFEALFEASWRARDYIDFDRRGAGMGAIARVIPFLNASLQGMDKFNRHMLMPVARQVLGLSTTGEDARAFALAWKSWAKLAGVVTASVSLYALTSRHEDQNEPGPWTRSTHWIVKNGEAWGVIPKPHELAPWINLGEAMFDAMARNDPAAAGRWWDSLGYTLAPPHLVEDVTALKAYFEIKSNRNFFTDAPIVPDHLLGLEPWLQYTERTSALSRRLGELFNVSPLVADHLILSFTGSIGRSLVSLYNMAQPDAPDTGWDDFPIVRRFIKDASRGSQSVTMFWELAGQREGELEGKAKSWKALAETGDMARAADFYASLDPVEKAYVGVAQHEAKVRRLHPIVRARGAVQAIGAVRRELAVNEVLDAERRPVAVSSAERAAADDILSELAMAIARNGLKEAGVKGWAQRSEMDESGYYRELEALNPALLDRLGNGYVEKKIWSWEAVKGAWPELRDRVLEEGSAAGVDDLVAKVESVGPALQGIKRAKRKKPALVPG